MLMQLLQRLVHLLAARLNAWTQRMLDRIDRATIAPASGADPDAPPADWLAEIAARAPHLLDDGGFWQQSASRGSDRSRAPRAPARPRARPALPGLTPALASPPPAAPRPPDPATSPTPATPPPDRHALAELPTAPMAIPRTRPTPEVPRAAPATAAASCAPRPDIVPDTFSDTAPMIVPLPRATARARTARVPVAAPQLAPTAARSPSLTQTPAPARALPATHAHGGAASSLARVSAAAPLPPDAAIWTRPRALPQPAAPAAARASDRATAPAAPMHAPLPQDGRAPATAWSPRSAPNAASPFAGLPALELAAPPVGDVHELAHWQRLAREQEGGA